MAYVSKFLPPFDPDAPYVAIRGLDTVQGRIEPGQPFPRSAVTVRTLRQLYDQRRIGLPPEGPPPPPPPVWAIRQKRRGRYVITRDGVDVSKNMRGPEAEAHLATGEPFLSAHYGR